MIRWLLAAIGLALALGITAKIVQAIDSRKYDVLEETTDSLRLRAAATDVRIAAADARHLADSTWADSMLLVEAEIRDELRARERATRAARARLDSARATVDEDTLSAELRGLLAIEREVADGFRVERDLGAEILASTRARLVRAEASRDSLRALVLTLVPERDKALEIVAGYQARLDFNLWRWIGEEIPTLLACAAGGSIASVAAGGDVIVGAGIGLGSCVIVRAVF